jgi:hypothetical protein
MISKMHWPRPHTGTPGRFANTATRYRHKATGYTREFLPDGRGYARIVSPDGAETIVAFMAAGSWQNLPNDCRTVEDTDRIVIVSGAPLPVAVVTWLTDKCVAMFEDARERFQRALDDADDRRFSGDDY